MSHLGPWTRDQVMLLHIFVLLFVWFLLDRFKIYLSDIPRYWYRIKLYYGAWRGRQASKPKNGDWAGP